MRYLDITDATQPLDDEQTSFILKALDVLAAAKRDAARRAQQNTRIAAADRSATAVILSRDAAVVEDLAKQVRVRTVVLL